VDLHIQAFKLAEELSMPVMVCMDGFILTHAFERVDIPEQAQVDVIFAALRAAPSARHGRACVHRCHGGPRSIYGSALPGPCQAVDGAGCDSAHCSRIQSPVWARLRVAGAWLPHEDAETIVVALGSVIGTLKDVVDEMREQGLSIGVLGIQSFRPFPLSAVREALQKAKRVVVLEKSFSVGLGGVVSTDVRLALSGLHVHGYTVVAGLGGRSITKASLHRTLREAIADTLQPLTFMDLDWGIVNRQLEREAQMRRSGPIAENLLRDVGAVASKVN
jgi:pyruvate ferredoxin oxidoreductase alpha subunit